MRCDVNPAYRALMDQHVAELRDVFDTLGVDVHDPEIRHALLTALHYVSAFPPQWQPWAIGVVWEVVA